MKTIIITLIIAFSIATAAYAQNVNIPDANFKKYLVENQEINTNGDAEIQVSEAEAFKGGIYCPDLGLYSLLGIEAFTSINSLDCSLNNIESLDLEKNIKIAYLRCSFNQLSKLKINNCNNYNMSILHASYNPSLSCIQVDDADYSISVWQTKSFSFDPGVNFSEDCLYSSLEDDAKYENSYITPFPNPTNGIINFSEVVNVRVSNLMGQIVAEMNNSTTIDISNESTGTYIIQYIDPNGHTINQSMIMKE